MFATSSSTNKMVQRICVTAVAIAMTSFAFKAHAEDLDKMFTISGFGTAAVTQSSNKLGDYVSAYAEQKGPGYTSSVNTSVDSKFAVQLGARMTDSLSAVVQVIASSRADGSFSPALEWANVKYAINNDFSVRLGRTALPVYMTAETRLLGFSNPWIRPPIETYSMYSLTSSDGIDLSYRHGFGSVSNTVQVWHGKSTIDVANLASDLKGTMSGVANTVEYGALTARAAYNQTDFTLPIAPGYTLLFQSKVFNIGASYDPGTWFVQGEVTRTTLGTTQRATLSTLVTAGMRFNQLTPYLTYSMLKMDDNQVTLPNRAQTTTSAGIRWDFRKNMDLKLQVDRVALASGSNGLYAKAKPGLAGSNGTVIAAALDFIF